jgi:hypothetical protein
MIAIDRPLLAHPAGTLDILERLVEAQHADAEPLEQGLMPP